MAVEIGYTATHLDQAVKSAPRCPLPVPAIGVEPGHDQPGVQRAEPIRTETERPQRPGAQAGDDDVGLTDQFGEPRPVTGVAQIQGAAALPRGDLRHHRGYFDEAGW